MMLCPPKSRTTLAFGAGVFAGIAATVVVLSMVTSSRKEVPTTNDLATVGASEHVSSPVRQEDGDLQESRAPRRGCGTFWFYHVPKTGGTTVQVCQVSRCVLAQPRACLIGFAPRCNLSVKLCVSTVMMMSIIISSHDVASGTTLSFHH
jgi:hypothetical protein